MISIGNGYSIKEVANLHDFEKLRTVWDNLAKKQGPCMPFLCFDWFNMWLQQFLKDNKLLILIVYRGDQLVAIAPFVLLREKLKSISVKKIELIGNVYSTIRNFIFDDHGSEEKKRCLLYIFNYLFNKLNGWDVIDLWPLLEDDENLNILQNIIHEKGYQNWVEFYSENWYMNGINYSGDEYLNKRSKDIKKSLRRRKKKLEESGRVEFKMVKNDEKIDRYMDYYYEVYAKSWKKQENLGPTFHRDLAKLAGKNGWLRLGILFLSGVPIATQFSIMCNNVGFFLKTAYDENYKEYGLGNIMHYETIRYMIDHDKIESIDLGAGSEEYKKFWVSDKREMKRILLFKNSFKGSSLAFLNNRILPAFNKYKLLKGIKEIVASRLR